MREAGRKGGAIGEPVVSGTFECPMFSTNFNFCAHGTPSRRISEEKKKKQSSLDVMHYRVLITEMYIAYQEKNKASYCHVVTKK